jgi:tRNA dimethylallyltransferase
MNGKSERTRQPKKPLIVVTGPTASGKTSLGVFLGKRLGGEVVNADARYLYRGFDIGVAKPTIAERERVPHHLIDVLEPTDELSVALFQDAAYQAIGDIHQRGVLPILVGGSPQYVNAVVEGWSIPRVAPDEAFRLAMEFELQHIGVDRLSEQLRRVDQESAERCGRNPRRIIRALEVFEATGKPMSELQGKGPPPYDSISILLDMPRELLYQRTDERVDEHFRQGLVEEVRGLLNQGISPATPAFGAIGYRQLVPYLKGEMTLENAVDAIKHATRRYVRHQQTWFRKNPQLIPISVMETDWHTNAAARVEEFLRDRANCE